MGRARITLKCIPNKKSRKVTFNQRMKGLKKKISEFSTMCGVEACLIVYEGNHNSQALTWPQDLGEVHSIIEKYGVQPNDKSLKNFSLKDFFINRKNMIKAEIFKVKKDIAQIKYPTWGETFKNLDEEHTRNLIATLDAKIAACDQRMSMLKNNQQTKMSCMLDHHDTGSQSQMLQLDPQMSQFDPNLIQLIANNNMMVDSSDQVGVSLDCTKQIDDAVDSTKQLQWPVDFASEFGEFQYNWTSQPSEVLVDWNSQLPESNLEINGFRCQNVPQHLCTLPPTMDEVLVDDYNNVLQAHLYSTI